MSACLNNLDLMPEPDIEDALSSINFIIANKGRRKFPLADLLNILSRVTFDFKKEIANDLRRTLVIKQIKLDGNIY